MFQKAMSLLIFTLWAGCSFGQSTGSLTGRVINAKTREPVPFATVFLANTMIGAPAKEDGTFRFIGVPVGEYDFTVSSIGYLLKTFPVRVSEGENKVEIELAPEARVLKEVTVKPNLKDYAKHLATFKQFFLGGTANASKCRIKNIDDVDFSYDDETRVFTAACTTPIEIENLALGYRILYLLQEFKLDYKLRFFILAGIPRFEPLTPKNDAQLRRWTKERDRAFYGSMTHFMLSLKAGTLKRNMFSIFLWERTSDWAHREDSIIQVKRKKIQDSINRVNQRLGLIGEPVRLELDSSFKASLLDTVSRYWPTDEAHLFQLKPDRKVQLKIVFKGEPPEPGYNNLQRYPSADQGSSLKFDRNKLVIQENGYYENPLSFFIEGYLGWSEKVIGELLPLEYIPQITKK